MPVAGLVRCPVCLRKAYQRAIVVPGHMLEVLWKEWEAFETGGSTGKQQQQLGRKLIDEWRPRYTAARGVYRERKRRLDQLSATILPLPPGRYLIEGLVAGRVVVVGSWQGASTAAAGVRGRYSGAASVSINI